MKQYEPAKIEVSRFAVRDVVTASAGWNEGGDGDAVETPGGALMNYNP